MVNLIECLLDARHDTRYFTYMILFDPDYKPG